MQQQYPVSKVCPACGGSRHRKVTPKTLIAFKADRVCVDCRTRYTPPTPIWAGVVFLLLGLGFVFFGLIMILGEILSVGRGGSLSPIGAVVGGGLTVLGGLAIGHGVRSFMTGGKG